MTHLNSLTNHTRDTTACKSPKQYPYRSSRTHTPEPSLSEKSISTFFSNSISHPIINGWINDMNTMLMTYESQLEKEISELKEEKTKLMNASKEMDLDIQVLKYANRHLLNDKNKLQEVNQELEKDKVQVLTERSLLMTEKDKVEHDKLQLEIDRDNLIKDKTLWEEDKERLLQEKRRLERERQILLTDKERLEKENQQLMKDKKQLMKEKTNLIKYKERYELEVKSIEVGLQQLYVKESNSDNDDDDDDDQSSECSTKVGKDPSLIERENRVLRMEKEKLQEDYLKLSTDKIQLRSEIHSLNREKNSMTTELQQLNQLLSSISTLTETKISHEPAISRSTHYEFLYLPHHPKDRMTHYEAAEKLETLGVDVDMVIDIHFPVRHVMALLVDSIDAPRIVEILSNYDIQPLTNFKPNAPENLHDPFYKNHSIEIRTAIASKTYRQRLWNILERVEVPSIKLAVAKSFRRSGWITKGQHQAIVRDAYSEVEYEE